MDIGTWLMNHERVFKQILNMMYNIFDISKNTIQRNK